MLKITAQPCDRGNDAVCFVRARSPRARIRRWAQLVYHFTYSSNQNITAQRLEYQPAEYGQRRDRGIARG